MPHHTPVRIGILGVGMHAREILIPALEKIPDLIQPVALATADPETARRAESQYRLRCHVGYQALVDDPAVEAVIVASHDHERHARAALAAGKHVFNETPAIATRDGARQIRELCRTRNLVYQVGYCLRYAPVYRKLKTILDQWRAESPGPRTFSVSYYPYIGHFHNLLLYLSGEIQRVLEVKLADNSGGANLLQFTNGDLTTLTWSAFHNDSPPIERVSVTHPTGRLVADDGRLLKFYRTTLSRKHFVTELSFDDADALLFEPTYSIPYGQNTQLHMRGYVPELEEFARCVRSGGTAVSGVDDAEAALLVRQALARSGEQSGMWVEVER